jgi:hypothetical protein
VVLSACVTTSVSLSDNRLSLVRKFTSNHLLVTCLRLCLIHHFDLLHNSDPNRQFMARIDVGIEPSDIATCFQLFAGGEIKTEVEGMLQLNTLSTCNLVAKPLTPNRLHIWHCMREKVSAEGGLSDLVGLVEFVNDTQHSITTPIQIPHAAIVFSAQHAEPFQFLSALGIREVPMSAMACLEFVSSLLFLAIHPDIVF